MKILTQNTHVYTSNNFYQHNTNTVFSGKTTHYLPKKIQQHRIFKPKNFISLIIGIFSGFNISKLFIKERLNDQNKTNKINSANDSNIKKLQTMIESGNGKIDLSAYKPLDINHPVFNTNNFDSACQYIEQKSKRQACILQPDDIKKYINSLSRKYKVSKNYVAEIMAKITQFGSYNQLNKLGEKLSEYGITDFYGDKTISLNKALRYIAMKKGQIPLQFAPEEQSKIAYVLDDASTTELKKISQHDIYKLKTMLDKDRLVFVHLGGTCLKIGDKYYSYTALDGGLNLKALTDSVLSQMKKGKTFDEISGKDFKEQVKNVLGKEYADKIIDINLDTDNADEKKIAKQLRPNIPDRYDIKITIKKYLESFKNGKFKTPTAKKILLQYIDNMMRIYSPESIAWHLKQLYKDIRCKVEEMGKSMDDVVYLYPYNEKSYDIVDYTFMKVNNLDSKAFQFCDSATMMQKNKVYVLLDDISASGDSMIYDPFCYNAFTELNPKSNIIFASIATDKEAIDKMDKAIKNNYKSDIHSHDTFIYNVQGTSDLHDFKNKLSQEKVDLIDNILNYIGHIKLGICTAFPYMIPDNNSSFSAYLLSFCLNDNNEFANKAHHEKDLLNDIQTERKKLSKI